MEEWLVERKWDGICGQLIVRKGEMHIWSRGEELITDKFPELHPLRTALPSETVLDGEILPFIDGLPLPFQQLQTRIGRVNVTAKVLREAPVVLMAYDLLEYDGADLRERPLQERRALLEELVARTASPVLRLSPRVQGAKAYSGLTDAEITELDSFVKQHTIERFGPVRSVTPSQVFEVHFEGIQRSPRHKSGIALRFPRIARWRKDKAAKEANTLEDLRQLLDAYAQE